MKKLVFLAAVFVTSAVAQPVYRCGNSYSHEPCIGAEEVPLTVTEGVDKISGERRVATDLAIERMFRSDKTPIFGTDLRPTHGSWEDRRRRTQNRLTDGQARACTKLRHKILETAETAKKATGNNQELEKNLYEMRKKYRLDGC
ncbi:MAG: hypothetical protein ACK5NE_08045 [Brachymonas sp.]